MNNSKKIILFLIFCTAFLLRFYKLGTVPDGLNQDETSLGYNALSILRTAKDEHNITLPQNFQAFGEYKLPGYIYASVIPVSIFGPTAFGIRFVSALAGFFTVVIIFYLTDVLLSFEKNKPIWIPYLVTFMAAINPWSLHFSRAAFEVNLANLFVLNGVLFFLLNIKTKKTGYLYLSIISFSLSMYTYNIARLFSPILFIVLASTYRYQFNRNVRYIKSKLVLLTSALLIPFILGALSQGGLNSTSGTLILSSAKVQSGLQEIRSYFIGLPSPVYKLFFNYWSLTAWQYINNFFAHLSVSFYFINGSEHGNNSIGTAGQWYIFELPLVLWGAAVLYKKYKQIFWLNTFWLLGLFAVSALTRDPPQATRTFFILYPVTFFSGLGLCELFQKISMLKKLYLKVFTAFSSLTVISYFIGIYFASYYIRFPIYYARHWRTGDREVTDYIRNNIDKYEKIVIDSKSGFIYSSLLFYLPFDPVKFQADALWTAPDSEGFIVPYKFGKFQIREIDWDKDLEMPRTLFVTNDANKPGNIPVYMTVYYPERPVVISVGQNIFRYPVKEIAYQLIESDTLK